MARGSVNQVWGIGIEGTPGVAAAIATELLAYSFVPKIEQERSYFRGGGRYAPTVSQTINETMSGALEGILDYKNIVYALSMAFGAATITQPDGVGSPTVYEWKWALDGRTPFNPKTATVEYGDDQRSGKFNYGHLNSLKFEGSRTAEGSLSGDMVGQKTTPAASAISSGLTAVGVQPVAGSHWDFYSEANFAALATPSTKLAEIYKAEFDFSDLRSMGLPLDSTVAGFRDTVMGKEPNFGFAATLGADAQADAFLTDTSRNDELAYFSAKATGPAIDGSYNYGLKLDYAAFVDTFDAYGDEDGILTLPVDFTWAVDPTASLMANITVTTDVATL